MRLRRQWWYPILTTLYSTVALYYCIMLQTGTAVAQWQQTVKERRRKRKERESCSCHATPCREPTMRKGMRERERELRHEESGRRRWRRPSLSSLPPTNRPNDRSRKNRHSVRVEPCGSAGPPVESSHNKFNLQALSLSFSFIRWFVPSFILLVVHTPS